MEDDYLVPQGSKVNNLPKPHTGKWQSGIPPGSLTSTLSLSLQLSVRCLSRGRRWKPGQELSITNHYNLSESHAAAQMDKHAVIRCHIRKRAKHHFSHYWLQGLLKAVRPDESLGLEQFLKTKKRKKAVEILLWGFP